VTASLALPGLPIGREITRWCGCVEPIINEAMIAKFVAYLGVSESTLTKYEYCVKTFLSWMKTKRIVKPLRSDILDFRKDMEANTQANNNNSVFSCSETLLPFFVG
jgi:hypothetical protein